MMPFEQHFNTVFWSQKQTENSLPDFQTGFNMLHQKLGQSRVENEEFISFLKDRVAIEELYATKLADQGKPKNKNMEFEHDGAGLNRCFTKLKETSTNFGQHHKTTATELKNQVLDPLQEFHEKYKQDIVNSRQNVEAFLKQFDSLVKETEKSKKMYHKKCKEADRAEELALKNATVAAAANRLPKVVTGTEGDVEKNDTAVYEPIKDSVQLGSVTLLQLEFDSLIRRMREEIPTGEHRVPFLGRYQNTSSGEDIAKWLQHNLSQCKDSPAMSDIVGQQLIQNHNILRLIGQRGNKFISSSSSFYQWRMTEEESVGTADSNSTGSHPLSSFRDKVTINSSANSSESNLEQHKKARLEAEKADEFYRINVKRLDQMRMTIEQAMFSHFTEMEQIELERIHQVKQLISAFVAALSSSIPKDKIEVEEMTVYQESLKPDQEIQYLIQQCAISGFSPKVILYGNYYHGSAHDQVFGVSLEELGKQGDAIVPRFILLVLDAIQKGAKKLDSDTRVKLWSTLCPLDRIHAAHPELNVSSDNLRLEIFEEKDSMLLVGVLRYFLLELPECLLTYDFYDLVETFFVDDEKILVPTLSNLITTLPDSHFFTLKKLLEDIISYIKEYSITDNDIDLICQSMGPVILRPRIESYSTMINRLPVKLFKKLLTCYEEIFSESALKLHIESEKRRHAKPLVVTENDIQTFSDTTIASDTKEPEKEYQNTKRSSTIMSFIRPSVMGVFQKNSAPNPISPKPSTNRSVSLSFGSPITRSESPPLSPKGQNIHDVPDNLQALTTPSKAAASVVMFDIDDVGFFNDSVFENNSKSDAILKDMDTNNEFKSGRSDALITSLEVKEEVVDSFFFDDDDDDDDD